MAPATIIPHYNVRVSMERRDNRFSKLIREDGVHLKKRFRFANLLIKFVNLFQITII